MRYSSLYRIIAVLLCMVFGMVTLMLAVVNPLVALGVIVGGLVLVRRSLKQARKERELEALV